LLSTLRKETGTALLLITHDLGVVAETCDEVIVMYAGQVVERAQVRALFASPRHPYTLGLLRSIPPFTLDDPGETDATPQPLTEIPGMVPRLHELPTGCRFAPRCERAQARCRNELPQLGASPFAGDEPDRRVRCFFPVS
jgi:peptide/nickel transport system ATP-binding protein